MGLSEEDVVGAVVQGCPLILVTVAEVPWDHWSLATIIAHSSAEGEWGWWNE